MKAGDVVYARARRPSDLPAGSWVKYQLLAVDDAYGYDGCNCTVMLREAKLTHCGPDAAGWGVYSRRLRVPDPALALASPLTTATRGRHTQDKSERSGAALGSRVFRL